MPLLLVKIMQVATTLKQPKICGFEHLFLQPEKGMAAKEHKERKKREEEQ